MTEPNLVKTRKGINWAETILDYLKEHPSGVTVKDIAEGMKPKTTRVTVHKYLKILLKQGKVFAREVGVYNLYYSSERRFLPINFVSAFYTGILKGLKSKISSKEEFKELGYVIADVMIIELIEQFPKSLRDQIKTFKDFLEYFAKLYPYLDIIPNSKLIIEEDISEDGNKALFHFKNLNLFSLSEDFEYHYYLLTGIMEKSLSRIFRTEIQAKVVSIDIKDKSVKISMEKMSK